MKQLKDLKAGQKGRVISIDGSGRYISRITSIGLTVGSTVEIMNNEPKQPLLLFARDTMIALSRTESKYITLEVIN